MFETENKGTVMNDETTTTEEPTPKVDNSPTMTLVTSHGYPWIDKEGTLKFGVAVEISETVNSDDVFATRPDPVMVLLDSETEKVIKGELDFKSESLSQKFKGISSEALDALINLKRQTTLLKSYKKQLKEVKKLSQINFENQAQKDSLLSVMKKASGQSKSIMANITAGAPGTLLSMLESYAFKKHLLVTGDAGNGKTFLIDKYIRDNKIEMVQYNGHQGTESIDLIGHLIKLPDGTFGWKDGKLSSAFRKAKTEKVVLFIDEMLRIPVRELNLLVGSLTPNSIGELVLITDRPVGDINDGIVQAETISVPQENLWVVASTNQGSGYQTARIDEALKDRFRLFYQEMTEAEVIEIIGAKLKRHKTTGVFLKSLVSIIRKTEEIKGTGNIPRSFTIRHLAEAVDTAIDQKDIKKKMFELVNNIVSIDSNGAFNAEQKKIVSNVIKTTL